jgi:hypothetical protein
VQNHQFIFIGGLHRSGTSLLFQCLRGHPQVSAFCDTGVPEDEGQHLQSVYRPASHWGGPGMFGFVPEAHLTEASPLVSDVNRERLFSAWRPYWDLNRPALLEKTPQNLVQTRFLQAMFPESSFVIITRHPVAVAYATRKWSHSSLYTLLEHWCRCHEVFAQDRTHLRRVLTLAYEDLAASPEASLARIYRFLGLDPCSAVVAVRNDVNEKYFSHWRAARRRFSSRPYIEHLAGTFEARVASFGYSVHRLTDHEADAPAHARFDGILARQWCNLHRGGGVIRRLAVKSCKRTRNKAMALIGIARSRRSAVQ